MNPTGASGWFDHHRWWIDLATADDRESELATAHESNHRQLAYSTTFGILSLVLDELASERPGSHLRATVEDLVSCSERTHECFATWASVVSLGRGADTLEDHPQYLQYFRAGEHLVALLAHPYLQIHGLHAVARACMQPPVIIEAVAAGLTDVTLADLPSRLRPDTRFQYLRRGPFTWSGAAPALETLLRDDSVLAELVGRHQLTAEMFSPANHGTWQHLNELLYAHVAGHLNDAGYPTMGHNDHLAEASTLLDEAARLNEGKRLSVAAVEPGSHHSTLAVLRNYEVEGFSNGPLLRHRVHTSDTPIEAMNAATGDDAHIFITIQQGERLLANYTEAPSHPDAAAFARRTVIDEDGAPTVELLDVTNRDPSEVNSPRILVSAALSTLGSDPARRWLDRVPPSQAVVTIDLSLATHLALWLDPPGTSFRYCLLRLESFGRRLSALVCTVETAGVGRYHLMVRPLSHAGAAIHKAAFEELDPSNRSIVADPSIIKENDALPLLLAHLAGEETRFPAV